MAGTTALKEEVVLGQRWWVPRAMGVTHSARRRGACEKPREGGRADPSCSQRSAQCLEHGRCPQAMSVPKMLSDREHADGPDQGCRVHTPSLCSIRGAKPKCL